MNGKLIRLLCLALVSGTFCYGQRVTPESELSQPKMYLKSDAPPVFIGPGNLNTDLGKLKKGTTKTVTLAFTGKTEQENPETSSLFIRRKAYQVTGYSLAEAPHILNPSLDGNGQFTGQYLATVAGPVNEVIKVTSTAGSFFVYLQGEVVE